VSSFRCTACGVSFGPALAHACPGEMGAPEPDAPTWRVGDRAVWLSDKYEDATEVEVLAVGPELLAVKFVDAPEGRPFCTRPATLRRPAPKRRKVVVREFDTGNGLVWDEKGLNWEPTGRAHEFEVDE
jgi:hypothetical protein